MLRSLVDESRLAEAGSRFLGEHDFATFASGGEGVPWSERARRPRGSRRTVFRCESRQTDLYRGASIVEVRVVADGFLPRMVRNMIGAMVEVGQARREPAWIDDLLAARDRRLGPPTAPAHGLALWKIGYGDEPVEEW
jgi:tRNA pseudouridine38-40 synthase